MLHFDETIYALSSGALPAGVAVIRLSGRHAFQTCRQLCGNLPQARQAELRTIRNRNGFVIDQGLVIAFPSPASFTGEDCVELQVHGGRAVVSSLLDELAAIPGLRHAEAGEFVRRAFENGKLDLVEVEGLGDLIAAETEMQRRLAIEQSFGALSSIYDGWADRLLRARAFIEAELDFADEEDVPGSVSEQVWGDMRHLAEELRHHLQAARTGEIIRDGLKVVIVGAPNAGKSSLMNSLVDRDVAIVNETAGTTRDILHADIDIEGFVVKLYDTAGLRDASDSVEKEGIRRALAMTAQADVILHLFDITDPIEISLPQTNSRTLRIGTKADIGNGDLTRGYDLCISSKTGTGIDDIKGLLIAELREQAELSALRLPSRLRQTRYLTTVLDHLHIALSTAGMPIELKAEELRIAGEQLGSITGKNNTEDLLDVIFSAFCIGK